ncbi:hypothetical protein GMDG_03260 [Pseudogymnoascus destructans 20631-21]|uniref:Stc1 domain-containing protein n=1 Tax=Pseudogymnoascus destructans (strain ATCC MYA-4855 / 20631-21) TaxID=658429 RepID=L8G5N5_PSED2|nr:hypothetical protein GMDG_03260 [Pseudogymnoascus destructans 20631-21]
MSTFNWNENLNNKGKGIDLPATFKCRICSKVKPATNDHFSKKELKVYTSRIAMRRSVTGFSANLRCRHCSGENVFELLCQYCHVTKAKDDFSYNQRTAALSARCKACVNWQETNEPGTETLPGPSMALHPDTTLAAASNSSNPGNALSVLVTSTAQAADDGDESSSVWRTTLASNNTVANLTNVSARRTTTRPSVVEIDLPSAPEGFMAPTRMTYRGDDVPSESTTSNHYGRPSTPVSAATNIFALFDPFARRGSKAGKHNAGGSGDAVSTSTDSDSVADGPPGDMRTTPTQKTPTKKCPRAVMLPIRLPPPRLPMTMDGWLCPLRTERQARLSRDMITLELRTSRLSLRRALPALLRRPQQRL